MQIDLITLIVFIGLTVSVSSVGIIKWVSNSVSAKDKSKLVDINQRIQRHATWSNPLNFPLIKNHK
jgi:hypothetical protein